VEGPRGRIIGHRLTFEEKIEGNAFSEQAITVARQGIIYPHSKNIANLWEHRPRAACRKKLLAANDE